MNSVKLGEIVNIQTGKLDANAADENGLYPFFTTAEEASRINTYAYNNEVVLIAGNGNLNVKYYKGKFNAYQRTYILTNKDDIRLNMKYLYYFMNLYVEILRNQSIGGVIKYIKLSYLVDACISLPSLEVQDQIVETLNQKQRIIRLRQQQLHEMDNLTTSYFVKLFGNPISNNQNWNLIKLAEAGSLARGKSKHRPRNAPELLGGPYPLVQTGNVSKSNIFIKEYQSTYSKLGLQQSKLWPQGTLCITIAANIANTGILMFDACFPDSVVGFTPNNQFNTIFVQKWFDFFQEIIERDAPQSAQKNINLKILSKLEIINPPIELQNKFASIVEEIESQKQEMQESLELMEENFNALMQKAFKGELVSEEQVVLLK